MNISTLQHGATRNRRIRVGTTEHLRREIYCVVHGWFDLFVTGGNNGFWAKHGVCDRLPENGEGVEVKVFKKAA